VPVPDAEIYGASSSGGSLRSFSLVAAILGVVDACKALEHTDSKQAVGIPAPLKNRYGALEKFRCLVVTLS
jgi:hypothetical protein